MVAIFTRHLHRIEHRQPLGGELFTQCPHQTLQRSAQRERVRGRHAFEQIGLAGQGQGLRTEGRIKRVRIQQRAHRLHIGRRHLRIRVGRQRQHHALSVALGGIPAIAGVGVMRHAKGQASIVFFEFQDDRGGEAAQQRRHRLGGQVDKAEALFHRTQGQYARARLARGLAFEAQHAVTPVRADEAERHRNHQRLLVGLTGRGRGGLCEGKRVAG